MNKAEQLAELAAECAACTRCGLHAGRTRSVFSDGNPAARIMLIGEGPGYNEDQQGKPFVGQAGQLLDRMLAAIGLDRQQVYIANIVKCRPPGNRTPTPEEMQACLGYLEAQIALVQPQIIILSGATALQGLLQQKRSISRSRGQWLQWQGIWCMPIFHPAYLLRNAARDKGSPKWLTWQDLKAIKAKYLALMTPITEERRIKDVNQN
ncbi:MAG: uracil-DNA glycosylase [Candidatus Sericytochromatia bacterium]|nr:uracil-DNA glycosylase [Candidatus Sericytochromatia bacterium]